MSATILLFHRVNPIRDKLWDPMSPVLFEKIMKFLKKNYEVLPLSEICLNKPVTKKPQMAITFDDGYRDYIDFALPILKKYNFHSTMYVVTDCVENNMPTWTYVMDYYFLNTKKLEISSFDYGAECAEFEKYKWSDNEEQINYCKTFKQYLKKVDNGLRSKILENFIKEFDDVKLPENLMITWDELRSFDKKLVDIGSHSVSHPPLATIEDDVELEKEIRVSGEIIQSELGYFPLSISYPVGSYNQKVKEVTKKAGYKIGLALNQISYNPEKQDIYEVPRLELYNDSFLRNKIKIYGIEAAIKSLIKR